MSVYKPNGSPFYHYDFQIRRRRFHGSTGRTNRREAEKVAQQKRTEAKAEIAALEARGSLPMTLDEAVGRYWLEVGQFKNTADEIWSVLEWLVSRLGPERTLASITTGIVADLVARRRAEGIVTRQKARKGRRAEMLIRPISNARINRAVVQPLRRVMRRAKEVWGENLVLPEWKRVMLKEPEERTREASGVEEKAILAAVRDDYAPAFRFAFLTGCRLGEVVSLTWSKVKWQEGVVEVSGKGGRTRAIPITQDIRLLLWPLQGHHDEAVFTYVARRPDPAKGIVRGDRLPITYYGLKTRWRRDRVKSGVADFRFHDTRHTAATRLLRETGNLRLAQKLLGHTDITTTTKYAHADLNDIREGMEQVARSRKNPKAAANTGEGES